MRQLYPLPQVCRRKPTLSLPPARNRYSQADAENMKEGRRKRSQETATIATQHDATIKAFMKHQQLLRILLTEILQQVHRLKKENQTAATYILIHFFLPLII